jgi:protein dithiol oxidoreductase (disulfide-forming)
MDSLGALIATLPP